VSDLYGQSVAIAVRKLKDPRAIEPLIGTVRNDDRNVRVSAIYSLREFNDSRAVKALTSARNDKDLQYYADKSLEKLKGSEK
jgi:HEAT repeat protein